jgi:signal transduction histidine kinase
MDKKDRQSEIEELERRQEVAASLRDIFRILNSNRPLEEVLDYIIAHARKTLGADDIGIYRMEIHDDGFLYLRPSRGLAEDYIVDLTIQSEGGIIGNTILQKKPLIVPDSADVMELSLSLTPGEKNKEYLRVLYSTHRALLGVPFIIKGEVYGGIVFFYDKPREFKQEDIDLALAIADQTALAIENAQSREQIERRAEVAGALQDVFTILNSNRPFREALDHIVKRTSELLGADSVGLYKLAPDFKSVRLEAGWGLGLENMVDMEIPYVMGEMDEKYAHEPLVLPDVSVMMDQLLKSSPAASRDESGNLQSVKSMIATPVTVKDEIYGSLHLYYSKMRQFSEDDVELAKTFGDQAALAIENAQLRDQIEQRVTVAEGLRGIMEILNSDMPIKMVLDFIVQQASTLLGASAVAIYKLFPEDRLLRIQAASGISPEYVDQMDIPVGQAAVGKAVLTKEPVPVFDMAEAFSLSDDIAAEPKRRALLENLVKDYRSVLAVPLLIKDEVYGGITLYYPDPRDYTAEEIDLASTFANHVALAIEHERLDEQSQKAAVSSERNRLARELHDAVTQTLFSSSLIAEVLPKIWEKSPEEGRRRLEELRQLTKGALAEMRALLLELRPAVIVEADLGDLVRQLAEAASGTSRIPISVAAAEDVRLPAEPHMAFYRIAQEALNNVVKHSSASQVKISLTNNKGQVALKISDNGRGFDIPNASPESLGLGIMNERAVAAGVKLKVTSKPGQGTTVSATWTEQTKEKQ